MTERGRTENMHSAETKGRGTVARAWWEPLFVVFLFWYPLRHIHWGIDFWDTGYNYANFTYMEHMDSMWMFSTYLSNVTGRFLTGLPGADGLVGMNFYTGLFVSALALLGYWFCTRKLGICGPIAFAGELMAVSLCWCPTALLYNYLTYVLFLLCVILLYIGLTKEKMWSLFAAGICLGVNVFVRFSNLPEAALIVAVWVYAFLEAKERQKNKGGIVKKGVELSLRYTGRCLGGYLSALALMFGYLHIRYGIGNYVTAIRRLFAMTDNATDYKAASMLTGLIYDYIENLYWVGRIGAIVLAGMAVFALLAAFMQNRTVRRLAHIWFGAVAVLMIGWLYLRGTFSLDYHTYGPIQRTGTFFLMLALAVSAVMIFHPKSKKEEKLIAGLMILVILLTSLGSNNKNMPSLNNLFVAGPYTLWQCWRFVRRGKAVWEYGGRPRAVLCSFPLKAVLTAFLAMFLFLSVLFGAGFCFAEATGIQNPTATVDNNAVLRGVKMPLERAEWMTDISAYAEENNLQGREVLLYGNIPAMSYYLQMPPVCNPWCDLDSYVYSVMEEQLSGLEREIENGRERPVILLDREYYLYMTEGAAGLQRAEVPQSRQDKIAGADAKIRLIKEFADRLNYNLTYESEKFVIME